MQVSGNWASDYKNNNQHIDTLSQKIKRTGNLKRKTSKALCNIQLELRLLAVCLVVMGKLSVGPVVL